ncbi:MAG TPA: ROK family protein [Gemmataceae bacterium]|jgi:predicted NBD/HSP70 family sugar kinase|nr:ROK family protein [Gemmataceae bacterium]
MISHAVAGQPHPPRKILVIDIGGTKLKVLASGATEPRKAPSGKRMTPARMVEAVHALSVDWEYEAVSMGYPGLVGRSGPRSEPGNLGAGWVGFDFAAAFKMPVRVINDASMQALGSYEGGRMLFLGLGTGLGSAFIADNVLVPLELGNIRYEKEKLGIVLGRASLRRLGKDVWRAAVADAITFLSDAFVADYVVVGGGNAKMMKELPSGARRGHNLTAFRGGFRLWGLDNVPTFTADVTDPDPAKTPTEWRVI